MVDVGARAELLALRLSFALTTLFTTAAFAIALVTFFEAPQQSLEAMERVRKAVTEEMARLDPDVDVSVLFLSGR